jgi:hypothetical protein
VNDSNLVTIQHPEMAGKELKFDPTTGFKPKKKPKASNNNNNAKRGKKRRRS